MLSGVCVLSGGLLLSCDLTPLLVDIQTGAKTLPPHNFRLRAIIIPEIDKEAFQ